MKVLCVGSLNIDHVYNVDHIVSKGETILASKVEKYPGGKGLNQAISLSKIIDNVYMYGYVGEDSQLLFKQLKESNIDTRYITMTNHPTGHAIIQVDRLGENSIVVSAGANKQFSTSRNKEVISRFDKGDFLVIQNEINGIAEIISLGKKQGMKIILNPSPFNSSITKELMLNVDYLILNKKEAIQLSSPEKPLECIALILRDFPNINIVLTLGENGAYFANKKTRVFQESFKVTVKDTTCAGDTFLGYFIGSLINGETLKTAMINAAKASSICIQQSGASSSIPSFCEVKSL